MEADCNDVSKRQRMSLKDCLQPPEIGEGHGTVPPLESPEGTNPSDTLISSFCPL